MLQNTSFQKQILFSKRNDGKLSEEVFVKHESPVWQKSVGPPASPSDPAEGQEG